MTEEKLLVKDSFKDKKIKYYLLSGPSQGIRIVVKDKSGWWGKNIIINDFSEFTDIQQNFRKELEQGKYDDI